MLLFGQPTVPNSEHSARMVGVPCPSNFGIVFSRLNYTILTIIMRPLSIVVPWNNNDRVREEEQATLLMMDLLVDLWDLQASSCLIYFASLELKW